MPPAFSRIHKRFRTPAFATVLTGIIVAIPTFFVSLTEATDLASIGTIFAFVLVSGGILLIGNDKNNTGKGYRIPYLNSRYYLLPLWVIVLGAALLISYPGKDLFSELITSITRFPSVFVANPPVGIFIIVAVLFSLLSIIKKLSLIPVISVLANLYLMTGLGNHAWMRFGIWLAICLLYTSPSPRD